MAGAGYKLFNTGDVLTAAQVNTYLQEQTVMVFADAAARTTALSGVLAEGMITYLKSDDTVYVYNGSSWVSVSGSTVPTSYGYSAGKNAVLNSDFRIWQRGTSVNLANNTSTFLADRFACNVNFSAGTASISQQTFTPGSAPVSGYEGLYFHRLNTGTTSTYYEVATKLEDVRTFAGQTVTISFWAKASSSITIKNLIRQNFGSGGSANVDDSANFNITTSWVRYSRTLTLGSMSGKTIGTSSFLQIFLYQDTGALGGLTIDLWGLQLEAGSSASTFQTATGTLQGELAACQRYFYRANNAGVTDEPIFTGSYWSTTAFFCSVPLPVQMRTQPSLTANNPTNFVVFNNSTNTAATAISLDQASPNIANLNVTTAANTVGRGGWVQTSNANASLDFSSEL